MTGEEMPRARVRRRRIFRLVWVIPVIALAFAGWLVWKHFAALGPEITVSFDDASGLRVGQTPLKYRGVQIGEVIGIALSDDQKQAKVRLRLLQDVAPIASEGALFWVVRPQLNWGQVTGLGTVLSGPEIHVRPGKGETAKAEFNGLDAAPVGIDQPGLNVVLRTAHPKGIRVQTPVYYRGVEVGFVRRIDLAPNAISADLHITVLSRYAALVREGSAFWNTSGVSAKGSILKGLEVEIESLRAVMQGGIEFATPSETAARVKPGTVFFLHDKPKDEWLNWSAKIPLK